MNHCQFLHFNPSFVEKSQGFSDIQSTKKKNQDNAYPATSIDFQPPYDRNWLDQDDDIAYKTQSRSCKIQLVSVYAMTRRCRHPKAIDREALEDETDEAGNEACDEECADGPYRPSEMFVREESPVEEKDSDFDEG